MYSKPEIGSEIEFFSNTPNPTQPFALPSYRRGTVVQPFKWVDDYDFCVTTGEADFPVRVVDIRYVSDLKYITGSESEDPVAIPKIQSWTVQGSKGDIYIVTNDDGKWGCDCVAGRFGRHCKHVKQIKEKQ